VSSSTSSKARFDSRSSWWHSRMAKTVLLLAGIVAVSLYNVGDVVSGLLYDGYSSRDQRSAN
jgi:hypothetical protein